MQLKTLIVCENVGGVRDMILAFILDFLRRRLIACVTFSVDIDGFICWNLSDALFYRSKSTTIRVETRDSVLSNLLTMIPRFVHSPRSPT